MSGLVVQLIISWILLWLIERKDLGVLGFRPTRERIHDFARFFLITAACCAFGYFIHMAFGVRWKLNPVLNNSMVFNGVWWYLRSVLFEELIFRGAVLYTLIQRLGVRSAILISAAGFGIYHWFTFNDFGNPVAMLFTFIITGTMGVVLAYAYIKTYSLFIPVAIHFGWSFVNLIFSNGPIGQQILIPDKPSFTVTVSQLVAFLITTFPLALTIALNYFLLERKPQRLLKLNIERQARENDLHCKSLNP